MTTETTPPAGEPTQATAPATPPAGEPAEPTAPPPADSVDQLPDWAQKMVKDLRSENAKHRQAKTAAEKEAELAARLAAEEQGKFKELYEKTQADLQQAQAQVAAAELARTRDQIAGKLGLPAELAARLQGETAEEIEADAKVLLEAIPKPAANTQTDATSGVNGNPQTPGMSEAEVREMAAVYGVSEKALKEQLGIGV